IKFERNNRLRSHRFENEEYEEETYFDKTKLHVIRKSDYTYTKKGLAEKRTTSEKIKYLYGFMLERLYRVCDNADRSCTPMEILKEIEKARNIENEFYGRLTHDYIYIKYGLRNIEPEYDFLKAARVIDRDFR
ncbi:MAG: hypothetical protein JXN10_10595, partial [Clostridia bacterium]|nr:hypothetical protein [Clostridia bacterium]